MPSHFALMLDSSYSDHSLERDIIEEAGGELVVCDAAVWDEEHVLGQPLLAEAEVILVELAPITARVLEQARSCVLVGRYGVGVDNVDVDAASSAGIWVANVPAYAAETVADHAIMLLLALARELRWYTRRLYDDGWRGANDPFVPVALQGRVLGLVGWGNIGKAVARRALAMGIKVWAVDPYVPAEDIARAGLVPSELSAMLGRCDFLSLHCPLNAETRHMIRKDTLDMLRDGVIIVNTARGDLIDLVDLEQALDSGRVRSAGLDVFDPEPLPPGHVLRTHPAVIATPHMAYLSDSSVTALRTGVANNAAAVLRGGPPVHPVNSPRARQPSAPRLDPLSGPPKIQ
ncbi:MAG: C-terminal binding protein [Acidimicrobiales bacterium]|jgi:D-3-phosphoglycerate dehydrogenase